MRLIDEDEFSSKLMKEFHGMISDESLRIYQILQRLNEAPTATEWISIKEGKPRFGDIVLLFSQCVGSISHRLDIAEYNECGFCGYDVKANYRPVFWMRIPDLPGCNGVSDELALLRSIKGKDDGAI